jgi:succinate dehydrogenase/fumarate reductase flavoprotein subunit
MAEYVAVYRTADGLNKALAELDAVRKGDLTQMRAPQGRIYNSWWVEAIQVAYMMDLAELITKSALCRTESRGAHYRADFPEPDPSWCKHVCLKKKDGAVDVGTVPVTITKINPEVAK